jgi:hypothetical protein
LAAWHWSDCRALMRLACGSPTKIDQSFALNPRGEEAKIQRFKE